MIAAALEPHRCGTVAIVGRPNVGKSTLLNSLVGQKLSITSSKPQTTRHQVTGVLTRPHAQFVFVDTPGFQTQHANALTRTMNRAVRGALEAVDVVVLVVEAGRERGVVCPADAASRGLEIIDLQDVWAPRLFTPEGDGPMPSYRATYLALAREHDEAGKQIDPAETLGEHVATAVKETHAPHRFLDGLLEAELVARDERRVRMAEHVDGDAAGKIEVARAVRRGQPSAFPPLESKIDSRIGRQKVRQGESPFARRKNEMCRPAGRHFAHSRCANRAVNNAARATARIGLETAMNCGCNK